MADTPEISDVDVLLRIYRLLTEQAKPGDGWTLDLALVDQVEESMQLSIEYAESDAQVERATEAVAAARQLKHAIRAYGQVE